MRGPARSGVERDANKVTERLIGLLLGQPVERVEKKSAGREKKSGISQRGSSVAQKTGRDRDKRRKELGRVIGCKRKVKAPGIQKVLDKKTSESRRSSGGITQKAGRKGKKKEEGTNVPKKWWPKPTARGKYAQNYLALKLEKGSLCRGTCVG